MPVLTAVSVARAITGIASVGPGWRVEVQAPPGADVEGMPAPSDVVAWALLADDAEPGGGIVVPVFIAGERTWTPDQYRVTYGQQLSIRVVRG